jgi:hypothetical protein
MTNSALRLRTPDGVRAALDALSNRHPVTCVDGGREPVWRIRPEDEHEAAFYRNTLIDAFLETSIVELALAYARRVEGDRLDAFWSQAMRLRDLLKFDFYFADSAAFREHVAEEMSWFENWETQVAAGGADIDNLLRAKRPLIAGAMLRPFFEAYEIVADALRDAPAEIDEKDLTKKALGLGNTATRPCRRCCSRRRARWSPTRNCWRPPPTWPSGGRRFVTSSSASCATWTRSSSSPSSSSSRAKWSVAAKTTNRPRALRSSSRGLRVW